MIFAERKNTSHTRAFTLLELLIAMTILAMMLTLMFSILSGSMLIWEGGNKRIEAAQIARVGLNIIANDLRRAIADQQVSYSSSGNATTNTVPFFADHSPSGVIDLLGNAENAAGSQQIFGVLATGKTNQPFEEFGYICAYIASDEGNTMDKNRYYLVRKSATASAANFYLRGNATSTFANDSDAFIPLIENCVRMELSYPQTNAAGAIDTDSSGQFGFTDTWESLTNLPAGVLVSIWVLDSKTAKKIASLRSAALSQTEIDSITNSTTSTDAVTILLRRGAVRMQRFIPLNKH